jgi:hypothetical protein
VATNDLPKVANLKRLIPLVFAFSPPASLPSDRARILRECVRRQIFRTALFRQMARLTGRRPVRVASFAGQCASFAEKITGGK